MAGSMEVILTEDIPKLGNAGEVVKVRRGYGRNYLLPKGKAMLATRGRVKQLEHQKRVIDEKLRKEMVVYEVLAEKIVAVPLTFKAQASAEGKLFGSVTNADIAGRLGEHGFVVDRRKIQLGAPIKQTGEHEVSVRLHRDVIQTLTVSVVAADVEEPPQEALPQDADSSESADSGEAEDADEEAESETLEEGDEDP